MPLFKQGQQHHDVRKLAPQRYSVDGQEVELEIQRLSQHHMLLKQGAQQKPLHLLHQGREIQVWYEGESYTFSPETRQAAAAESEASNRIMAPLTGKVIDVPVQVGQAVEKGFALVILESMKMETNLAAPFDASVAAIHCQAGDSVSNGQLLVELEAQTAPEETENE